MFPENLKKWRVIRGYTRRDMAKKLDMLESSYGFYETGRTKPDTAKLLRIAEILQVSTDDLLDFHIDEFQRFKNFWEEYGFKIEETLSGGIEILFNERVEQITIENGKTTLREYELLPISSREEFIRLTRAVDNRIKEQMSKARASLFDAIINSAHEELGKVTETADGMRIYKVKGRRAERSPNRKRASD